MANGIARATSAIPSPPIPISLLCPRRRGQGLRCHDDYCYISSAAKYEQGTWGATPVRDHGNHAPFSTSAAVRWLAGDSRLRCLRRARISAHARQRLSSTGSGSRLSPSWAWRVRTAAAPNYQFPPRPRPNPPTTKLGNVGASFCLGTMVEGGYNNGFKRCSMIVRI